jgi:hypothetical protein
MKVIIIFISWGYLVENNKKLGVLAVILWEYYYKLA